MLKAHIIKHRRELRVEVQVNVAQGCSIGLFGASGTGKSTVLACLAGIEEPDGGYVEVKGLNLFPPSLPLYRRPIGYLTQEPGLFPHLSVGENISFGIPRDRAVERDQVEWIATLREHLRLSPLWNAPVSRISGGQARRVALARMLARRPPLVLLDEPFSGLDRQLVRELIDSLVVWKNEIGFSMIVVDHQAEILARLCSCVSVIDRGRVIQEGSWDAIRAAPANPILGQLLKPL